MATNFFKTGYHFEKFRSQMAIRLISCPDIAHVIAWTQSISFRITPIPYLCYTYGKKMKTKNLCRGY